MGEELGPQPGHTLAPPTLPLLCPEPTPKRKPQAPPPSHLQSGPRPCGLARGPALSGKRGAKLAGLPGTDPHPTAQSSGPFTAWT